MEKTVGAVEARRSFGRILQDVASKGDKVVVERHGEAIAVVVPIQLYDQWKKRREAFFDQMERTARVTNLSPVPISRYLSPNGIFFSSRHCVGFGS